MRQKHNLTPWEWITLIGVILAAGVSVTVFAMNTFEISGASKAVKVELKSELVDVKSDVHRVERKVDALLLNNGLNPKRYETHE